MKLYTVSDAASGEMRFATTKIAAQSRARQLSAETKYEAFVGEIDFDTTKAGVFKLLTSLSVKSNNDDRHGRYRPGNPSYRKSHK